MRPQRCSAPVARSFLCCRAIVFCRRLSTAALPHLREDIVQVPVGSNGHVTLSILHAKGNAALTRSNLVIYLPPGALFEQFQGRKRHGSPTTRSADSVRSGCHSFAPQENLAMVTQSTTVTINYRLGRLKIDGKQQAYKFPTPIHDTLVGLDWAVNEFKPDNVFVFGRHIGGSLAVMLALTESRNLRAVAAEDPVCDWVGLDDYCITEIDTVGKTSDTADVEPQAKCDDSADKDNELSNGRRRYRKKKEPSVAPTDLVPLLEARRRFFRTPSNYFDSFSSPTLLLRTSGKYIPLTFPAYFTGPEYPIPILKRQPKTEADALFMTDLLSSLSTSNAPTTSTGEGVKLEGDMPPLTSLIKPIRRRKVLSRWPPSGLDYGLGAHESQNRWRKREETKLPDIRIFVHDDEEAVSREEGKNSSTGPLNGKNDSDDEDDNLSAQLQALGLENYSSETGGGPPSYRPGHRTGSKFRPRGSLRNIGKISGSTVLARQGKEMVSLMHNACFWGRGKGAADRCVKLISVPTSEGRQPADVAEERTDQKCDTATTGPRNTELVEVQAGQFFTDILREGQPE